MGQMKLINLFVCFVICTKRENKFGEKRHKKLRKLNNLAKGAESNVAETTVTGANILEINFLNDLIIPILQCTKSKMAWLNFSLSCKEYYNLLLPRISRLKDLDNFSVLNFSPDNLILAEYFEIPKLYFTMNEFDSKFLNQTFKKFKEIDLAHNSLTDRDIQLLVNLLEESAIEYLNLSYNSLSDKSKLELLRLKNVEIKSLGN